VVFCLGFAVVLEVVEGGRGEEEGGSESLEGDEGEDRGPVAPWNEDLEEPRMGDGADGAAGAQKGADGGDGRGVADDSLVVVDQAGGREARGEVVDGADEGGDHGDDGEVRGEA